MKKWDILLIKYGYIVFGQLNKEPNLILPDIEKKIYHFISEQFREIGCPARIVNGMPDHIHCLFLLNSQKSIAEVIKQIKGSSSHFINQNNLTVDKFSWQTGYAAYSISESVIEKVFNYIKNQKEHHQKNLFNKNMMIF